MFKQFSISVTFSSLHVSLAIVSFTIQSRGMIVQCIDLKSLENAISLKNRELRKGVDLLSFGNSPFPSKGFQEEAKPVQDRQRGCSQSLFVSLFLVVNEN